MKKQRGGTLLGLVIGGLLGMAQLTPDRLAPFVWVLMDLIVTGDPLHSLHGTAALRTAALALGDVEDFPFLDPPHSRAIAEGAVQQCHRVSPGPDFVLVVQVLDMAAYLALVERLFTQDANVRNVKAFFSVRRAKFETRIPLPAAPVSA